MQPPSFIEPIMDNVLRLKDDAVLLRDNGRYASAFVLAVIALEEIGKMIHLLWKAQGIAPNTKRRTQHLSKQAAAQCVILSATIVSDIEVMLAADEPEEGHLSRVAERITNSPEGQRLISIEQKTLDLAKQAGLYLDDAEGPQPIMRVFTAKEVDEVLAQCVAAIKGVMAGKPLSIAKAVFDAAYGKLDKVDFAGSSS